MKTHRPFSIEFLLQASGIRVIDQTLLPHQFIYIELKTLEAVAKAIETMQVRGAPLIGAVAAFGLALALKEDASDDKIKQAVARLLATRPTAVNLRWAINRVSQKIFPAPSIHRFEAAWVEAEKISAEDEIQNRAIGEHGLAILKKLANAKTTPLNIMTHCNAGWLGTLAWGTALAPIYLANEKQIPVHVWVSETRPRNQGLLTTWELAQQNIPHTLVADNACGHLIQRGQVDIILVGADRVTRCGDVCNKIGTYLKALAAKEAHIPFYVALPSSTIDWELKDGVVEIPIEQRSVDEIIYQSGRASSGQIEKIEIATTNTRAANFAFDVTPARLVTALITERGVCEASEQGLLRLYPEQKSEEKNY